MFPGVYTRGSFGFFQEHLVTTSRWQVLKLFAGTNVPQEGLYKSVREPFVRSGALPDLGGGQSLLMDGRFIHDGGEMTRITGAHGIVGGKRPNKLTNDVTLRCGFSLEISLLQSYVYTGNMPRRWHCAIFRPTSRK